MSLEGVTSAEVRQQLAEILKSKDFLASERLQRFLTFIVEESLKGRGKALKAYCVAVEVFKLGMDFDPSTNPLIRVEAGRLRSKLDHYYLTCPDAPVRISIPKGGYAALFCKNPSAQIQVVSGPAAASESDQSPQSNARTTILILPFINANKSEEVERFLLGLANEITISLTRFSELAVVSCNMSACPGLGNPGVCYRLDARFTLSGSVEIEGEVLKVWIHLMDVASGVNVWAEKFSGTVGNTLFFELQETIAEQVSSRLADDFGLINRTLLRESMGGSPGAISQREAGLFYYQWASLLTPAAYKKALGSMEALVAAEPDNITAQAMLADLYASDYQWSYGLVENSLERSLELALKAANLDPNCQVAHVAAALNYYLRQEPHMFAASAEKALSLNPTNLGAVSAIASWAGLVGDWDKSLELMDRAMTLNPTLPGWAMASMSLYHYLHGDYEKAFTNATKIMMPGMLLDSVYRLISSAKLGLEKEVRLSREDLFKAYPDFEQRGLSIVRHNICNKAYIKVVCEGLAAGGVRFSSQI